MTDKFKELSNKLEIAKFLNKILSYDNPFRKSIVAPSDDVWKEFNVKFVNFVKSLVDETLSQNSISKIETPALFTPDEISILKALVLKHKNNPKIQQLLPSLKSEAPPTVVNGPAKEKRPTTFKVMPPVQWGIKRTKGIITDPESIAGNPAYEFDSGAHFTVIRPHSIEGWWQCQLDEDPSAVFLIHDSEAEWVDGEKK